MKYTFEVYKKVTEEFISSFYYEGDNCIQAYEKAVAEGVHNYTGQNCCVKATNENGVKIKFEIGS